MMNGREAFRQKILTQGKVDAAVTAYLVNPLSPTKIIIGIRYIDVNMAVSSHVNLLSYDGTNNYDIDVKRKFVTDAILAADVRSIYEYC